MKKFIMALAFGLVVSSANVEAAKGKVVQPQNPLEIVGDRCAPGDVIFYGQNQKHTKEVLICQWGTNVFYSFGKIGKPAELDLKLDSTEVERVIEDDEYRNSEVLFFKNGDIVYEIGASVDKMLGDKAEPVSYIRVTRYAKGQLAEIVLDEATVVNGIRGSFVPGN